MKKEIFTLLLLALSIGFLQAKAHELNFGLFDLFEKDQSYYIEIRLDKTNLIEAVGNQVGHTKEDWNCSLSQYLDRKMSLAINGATISLSYNEFTYLDDVIVVTASLNLTHQSISEIKVQNTVLLETIENQTNIIKTSFHNKRRSFRLNADRTSTIIKY